MKKFPTKMKRKIGAPKGRQLCGAPNGALIMPNTVLSADLSEVLYKRRNALSAENAISENKRGNLINFIGGGHVYFIYAN